MLLYICQQEIRKKHNITNDFTPEEEEKVHCHLLDRLRVRYD